MYNNITFSPFRTMFPNAVFVKKTQGSVVKDKRVNRWTDPSLPTSTISQHFLSSATLFSKPFFHNVFFGLYGKDFTVIYTWTGPG